MYDMIVIGGGPAGVTAALRARELGVSVALIERDRMGGTCTNDGCVPTRVLARAARLAREAGRFSEYGLIGDLPEVDFSRLLTRTQEVVFGIHEKKQLIKSLQEAGVTVFTGVGEASFLNPYSVVLQDGTRLEADKFVICVGGRARRLNFPGAEHALIHSDVWSLKQLPGSIVIIGGAATGCQLASIFEAFGVQVAMLETSDRILRLEDSIISTVVEQAFRARGIQIITEIGGVERLEKNKQGYNLVYKTGDGTQEIQAEAVIAAVGWPGNVESLNLEIAGVKYERGFIPVDNYMRTSSPHIFAAGDITGRMGLVQRAGYDARVAVENAVLGVGQPYKQQIVPHGGFTDPEYGSVGLTEEQARADHDLVTAVVSYASLDRAVIDGWEEGACKLIVSRETHRILGAHVAGEQALEIIHLVATGMTADMWVEQLAELEIAYPTYTAILGLAARQIVRDLGVIPLSPQWRALGKSVVSEWERRDPSLD